MKIMERGQITIPKKYRDQYGIKPETELDFVPLKEGLLIVKQSVKKNHFSKVYGVLKKKSDTDTYINQIRGSSR
jgi:AbrB family looped-hinge helix DNA binding protein